MWWWCVCALLLKIIWRIFVHDVEDIFYHYTLWKKVKNDVFTLNSAREKRRRRRREKGRAEGGVDWVCAIRCRSRCTPPWATWNWNFFAKTHPKPVTISSPCARRTITTIPFSLDWLRSLSFKEGIQPGPGKEVKAFTNKCSKTKYGTIWNSRTEG